MAAPNAGHVPIQMMERPTQVIPGCPPGLQYLAQLDQILVHQQIELLEAIGGCEMNNKYVLKNSAGQQCYFAAEETECCMRMFCKERRGFIFHISDNADQQVMKITREFKFCGGGCCPGACCGCFADSDACGYEVTVESPPGNVIGTVRQASSGWLAKYDIKNETGDVMLKIKQRDCVCCPCQDNNFDVYPTIGDNPIGAVTKVFAGMQELFTKANNFSISFPQDLDVKMKALLLGACFLIDMMFFEMDKK